MSITIKNQEEIEVMAEGGRILALIIKRLEKMVRPGIKTEELEKKVQELISEYKVKPSFKNYQGFPACLCVCVNEEVVHVPPSKRILKKGDIVSLDLGIIHKGFHSDMAVTLGVGEISFEAKRLIRITKKALKLAIKKTRPGNTIGDIGETIQRYVESQGLNVIKELCGHGIGRRLHEDPQILNYGKRHKGEKLIEGMTICIEPMVSLGSGRIKKTPDGFGYQTEDATLSAHFEHTLAITKKGCKILTIC